MEDRALPTAEPRLTTADAYDRTALCLSGGGYRAAVYHVGALQRLNEFGLLPCINTFSAVSGGSITAGVLAAHWRSLRADEDGVFSNFDRLIARPVCRLASSDPQLKASLKSRLSPKALLKSRRGESNETDLLADHFDKQLFHRALLKDMPRRPQFIFSATNLRTGGRWELSPERIGEQFLGYTQPETLRLAEAVAASAANPLDFPPLLLRFRPARFEDGVPGAEAHELRKQVCLLDGALQDNFAIEAVWASHAAVLCSDGDHTVEISPEYHDWFGSRIWRSWAISFDKKLELSKRWLFTTMGSRGVEGVYIGLSGYHGIYGVSGSMGYAREVVNEIRQLPTGLQPLSGQEIETLINHGYTMTDAAVKNYLGDQLARNPAIRLPHPDSAGLAFSSPALETTTPFSLMAA